jgi:hypothetical protein
LSKNVYKFAPKKTSTIRWEGTDVFHDVFQKQFVTVSRDTKAYVWKLEEGKREFELFYTGPNGDESEDAFRIRACRFVYMVEFSNQT